MQCLYCDNKISLLRKFKDRECCSDEHRRLYEERQLTLALTRLGEAKPRLQRGQTPLAATPAGLDAGTAATPARAIQETVPAEVDTFFADPPKMWAPSLAVPPSVEAGLTPPDVRRPVFVAPPMGTCWEPQRYSLAGWRLAGSDPIPRLGTEEVSSAEFIAPAAVVELVQARPAPVRRAGPVAAGPSPAAPQANLPGWDVVGAARPYEAIALLPANPSPAICHAVSLHPPILGPTPLAPPPFGAALHLKSPATAPIPGTAIPECFGVAAWQKYLDGPLNTIASGSKPPGLPQEESPSYRYLLPVLRPPAFALRLLDSPSPILAGWGASLRVEKGDVTLARLRLGYIQRLAPPGRVSDPGAPLGTVTPLSGPVGATASQPDLHRELGRPVVKSARMAGVRLRLTQTGPSPRRMAEHNMVAACDAVLPLLAEATEAQRLTTAGTTGVEVWAAQTGPSPRRMAEHNMVAACDAVLPLLAEPPEAPRVTRAEAMGREVWATETALRQTVVSLQPTFLCGAALPRVGWTLYQPGIRLWARAPQGEIRPPMLAANSNANGFAADLRPVVPLRRAKRTAHSMAMRDLAASLHCPAVAQGALIVPLTPVRAGLRLARPAITRGPELREKSPAPVVLPGTVRSFTGLSVKQVTRFFPLRLDGKLHQKATGVSATKVEALPVDQQPALPALPDPPRGEEAHRITAGLLAAITKEMVGPASKWALSRLIKRAPAMP